MVLQPNATTERFERLIEALEPWLDRVVIVGGWTLPLLRLHPLAQPLPYSPVFTKDADIAVPLELRSQTGDVRERLNRLFGEVTDLARQASLMAAGRRLSPEGLVETCNAGLQRLFE